MILILNSNSSVRCRIVISMTKYSLISFANFCLPKPYILDFKENTNYWFCKPILTFFFFLFGMFDPLYYHFLIRSTTVQRAKLTFNTLSLRFRPLWLHQKDCYRCNHKKFIIFHIKLIVKKLLESSNTPWRLLETGRTYFFVVKHRLSKMFSEEWYIISK